MIKLNVAGYCHNCPDFEPNVEKDILYAPCDEIHETTITCKHKTRCEIICDFLRNEEKRRRK